MKRKTVDKENCNTTPQLDLFIVDEYFTRRPLRLPLGLRTVSFFVESVDIALVHWFIESFY